MPKSSTAAIAIHHPPPSHGARVTGPILAFPDERRPFADGGFKGSAKRARMQVFPKLWGRTVAQAGPRFYCPWLSE